MEEQVVSATGLDARISVDRIVRFIKQTGRIPAQRDTYYQILRTYE
jgi:cyclic dehypoxanthinyl futalosine synthase